MEKVDLNDLEQPNKKGRSALHFAARLSLFYIYPNLVKLLMTQGSLFNDHFPLHLKKVSLKVSSHCVLPGIAFSN